MHTGLIFPSLDRVAPDDHPYHHHLDQVVYFTELSAHYHGLYSTQGREEEGAEFSLRALVLQFMVVRKLL